MSREGVPKKRMSRPSVATDLGLKPFTRTILLHLMSRGSISPLEALAEYGSPRVAPQIYELRQAGYEIESERRTSESGHSYVRYILPGY